MQLFLHLESDSNPSPLKPIFPLVFVLPLFLSFAACGEPEDYNQLKEENVALRNKVSSLDSAVLRVGIGSKVLNKNLDSIARLEDEIRAELTGKKAANDSVLYEKLKKLNSISNFNRSIIEDIKRGLDENDLNTKMLLSMIMKLDDLVKTKEAQIEHLNKNLENLSSELKALLGDYQNLESNYKKQKEGMAQYETQIKSLETDLDEKKNKLHAAFYSFGTKKELLGLGVIKKGSVLGKSEINANFNFNTLNRVDTREFKELVIPSEKVILISNHPLDSYTIETRPKAGAVIRIHDSDKFWSLSKALIIQTGKE